MTKQVIKLKPGESVTIIHDNGELEVKEWLSISQFAQLSNLGRTTIYRKISEGKIKVNKEGKSPKINKSELLKIK